MTGWDALAEAVRRLEGRYGLFVGDLYIGSDQNAGGHPRWWALFEEAGRGGPAALDLKPDGRWLDLYGPVMAGYFDDLDAFMATLRASVHRLGPRAVADIEDFADDPTGGRP
jgi:hypothetical protein